MPTKKAIRELLTKDELSRILKCGKFIRIVIPDIDGASYFWIPEKSWDSLSSKDKKTIIDYQTKEITDAYKKSNKRQRKVAGARGGPLRAYHPGRRSEGG